MEPIISDLTFARKINSSDTSIRITQGPFPSNIRYHCLCYLSLKYHRWRALESIEEDIYSSKSDVYSYGGTNCFFCERFMKLKCWVSVLSVEFEFNGFSVGMYNEENSMGRTGWNESVSRCKRRKYTSYSFEVHSKTKGSHGAMLSTRSRHTTFISAHLSSTRGTERILQSSSS